MAIALFGSGLQLPRTLVGNCRNRHPTLEEKTKYEAIYKCFNIKYSYSGYSSIDSREDFNSTLNNMMYGEFSFFDSTTRLYDALPDTYPNAIQKLKSKYNEFY